MNNPTIWIVVPVFNNDEELLLFIKNIKKQTYKNYKVVIVSHGTKHLTSIQNDKIILLKESSDLWWTGAINAGIKYILNNTNTEVPILIINVDVIFNNDYLNNIMQLWVANKRKIIGSICIDPSTKTIKHANMILNKPKAAYKYEFKGKILDDIKTEILDSDVLKGRGTLISSFIFKKIGLYNEKYLPHYRADHELINRAKKKRYKVIISNNVFLYSTLDSPVGIDKNNRLSSLYNYFTNIRSVKNYKDLFYYSYLCFNPIYATYFFVVNLTRDFLVTVKKLYV